MRREQLDAVLVADRPAVHPDIARRWIESGKAMLLEKPGAKTARELSYLVALARPEGVSPSICYPLRCHPVSEAIHIISIGTVCGMTAFLDGEAIDVEDTAAWQWHWKEAPSGLFVSDMSFRAAGTAIFTAHTTAIFLSMVPADSCGGRSKERTPTNTARRSEIARWKIGV